MEFKPQTSHITTHSQLQDSQLNDTVTIIVSVTKDRTAKSFGGPDYQPLKFSLGSEFLVSQQPVHDLQSLALVIGELSHSKDDAEPNARKPQ